MDTVSDLGIPFSIPSSNVTLYNAHTESIISHTFTTVINDKTERVIENSRMKLQISVDTEAPEEFQIEEKCELHSVQRLKYSHKIIRSDPSHSSWHTPENHPASDNRSYKIIKHVLSKLMLPMHPVPKDKVIVPRKLPLIIEPECESCMHF